MFESTHDRHFRSGKSRAMLRDLTWGRPIFKAPTLPNPRIVFDPTPFRFLHPDWPRYTAQNTAR